MPLVPEDRDRRPAPTFADAEPTAITPPPVDDEGETLPTPFSDPALERTAPMAHLPSAETALREGMRLGGRYVLRRMLGMGGMGAVYLALDEVLGKEVALKVVRRKLLDRGRSLEALRDEVLLAQQVTHRNVCRIYDLERLERVGGEPLWVIKMEYVEGSTLGERVKGGPLEIEEVLPIARAICAGLGAAHAQGVVHRDLKPQNVMVESATRRVVLMDFGLARSQRHADDGEAGVSGTPEYMAPEQGRGEKLDGRADLYALGAMLFHLLTGRVPFPQARALARQGKPITAPTPDPRAARPDVPPWLARLVMRLLDKERERRPASARATEIALHGPYRRWRRFGAGALLAAVAVAGGALYGQHRAHRPEWRPHIRELRAWDENADLPAISPDGTRLAYLSDRDGLWRIYVEPLAGGSSRAVTPATLDGMVLEPDTPSWTPDGHLLFSGGHDRAFRVGLDGAPPTLVAEGVKRIAQCGPNALALVYASTPGCDRCMRLAVRAADGSERELLRLPYHTRFDVVRCDARGERVLFTRTPVDPHTVQIPGEIDVIDVAGGALRRLANDQNGDRYPGYPTFAPDGRSVIFSSARGGTTNLWEVAVSGGAPIAITNGEGPDLAATVSPDGKLLVFDNDVTSVPIFAVSLAGGRRRRIAPSLDDAAGVALTPDGAEAVTEVRRDGRRLVVAVPLASGEERVLGEGCIPTLSADGREVIFTTRDGSRTSIWAQPLGGGARRLLAEDPGRISVLRVGPDGIHVTRALEGASEAWHLPPGGARLEREAPAPINLVLPSPRGGVRIALSPGTAGPGVGRVIAAGRPLDDAKAPTLPMQYVAWDASGTSFVYWDGAAVRRYTLATGEDKSLLAEKDLQGLAVSSDGWTLYFATPVGHVRRHVIDNFADRPRPPGI